MLGIDIWNGSNFAVEGFGEQGSCTFPLLTQGNSVAQLYDVDRQFVIIDQEGVVQLVSAVHGLNVDEHRTIINNLLETSAEEREVENPSTFSITRAWPNPFNAAIRLSFDLPTAGHVEGAVFNLRGQLVDRISSNGFAAGQQQVTWRPAVASGVYLIRLDAGPQGIATQRVVLVK